jgi:hypothetical protein
MHHVRLIREQRGDVIRLCVDPRIPAGAPDEADAGAGSAQAGAGHGRPAAQARVVDRGDAIELTLWIASGHWPMTLREDLLDAVFGLSEMIDRKAVRVALPAGDGQLLAGIGARCSFVRARSAGSTCLVDARVGFATHPIGAADSPLAT